MSRRLFTITSSIAKLAHECLCLRESRALTRVHIAECFPLPPEEIVCIWENAIVDAKRHDADAEFDLRSVTVFKDGTVAAEFVNRQFDSEQGSLF